MPAQGLINVMGVDGRDAFVKVCQDNQHLFASPEAYSTFIDNLNARFEELANVRNMPRNNSERLMADQIRQAVNAGVSVTITEEEAELIENRFARAVQAYQQRVSEGRDGLIPLNWAVSVMKGHRDGFIHEVLGYRSPG